MTRWVCTHEDGGEWHFSDYEGWLLTIQEEELSTVSQDAIRYRFLRSNLRRLEASSNHWSLVTPYGDIGDLLQGEELDAAVDALIANETSAT